MKGTNCEPPDPKPLPEVPKRPPPLAFVFVLEPKAPVVLLEPNAGCRVSKR